ncbi:MAG TPA: glycosyltransferase, partial [Candidatus Dormibacteraeota bacterium]|nr:glycosyltransferase [Candidatus Dormibacteraeota bacterium]
MFDLSIVVPAFNEADRLPAGLETVYGFLARAGRSAELILVDDGSTDQTLDRMEVAAR